MSTYKVLIVDDEEEIRDCLQYISSHKDLQFTLAENGQRGLDMILAQDFDCVVSDIKMPVMTGIEMLKRMRAAGKTTPIVFISAFANEDYAHLVSDYGAIKLVNKLDLPSIKNHILEAIKMGEEMKAINKVGDEIGSDFMSILNRTK
jgi:YesN/AraC family two-component response regulator